MTTPTVQSKNQILNSNDGLVDLFTLDCSKLGGSVYHFTPQCYSDGTELSFGGQVYNLVPIGLDGFESKSTATTLPRPTLTVSNVNGVILGPVVSLGDIVGAVVTYIVTYVSYLDGQANPDATKYATRGSWKVAQKTSQTNQMIQFELACPLDMPGQMFPVRQILVDAGVNPPDGVNFPGVQPWRINGYQSL